MGLFSCCQKSAVGSQSTTATSANPIHSAVSPKVKTPTAATAATKSQTMTVVRDSDDGIVLSKDRDTLTPVWTDNPAASRSASRPASSPTPSSTNEASPGKFGRPKSQWRGSVVSSSSSSSSTADSGSTIELNAIVRPASASPSVLWDHHEINKDKTPSWMEGHRDSETPPTTTSVTAAEIEEERATTATVTPPPVPSTPPPVTPKSSFAMTIEEARQLDTYEAQRSSSPPPIPSTPPPITPKTSFAMSLEEARDLPIESPPSAAASRPRPPPPPPPPRPPSSQPKPSP